MGPTAPTPATSAPEAAPSRHSRRLLLGLLGALALPLLGPTGALAQEAERAPGGDLRDVLATGFLVEDRNGDGHADFVNARLLIPADPGPSEVAAAANLAARLAFESYGMDLDLMRFDSPDAGREGVPLVVIGRADGLLGAAGVDPTPVLADLLPGEGAVVRLAAAEALPSGGIWVVGADATGLLAAAEYVSGRYPGVWAPDGDGWEELLARIREHLSEKAGAEVSASLDRVVVSAARPGIARAGATLRLPGPDAREAVREALGPEGTAHELLVPGLLRLDLLVVEPAGVEERLRLLPSAPWEEDELPSWQPREVSDFTLSEFYTTRGIYRDSSDDLLPDRTEAWISLQGTAAAGGVVDLAMRVAHEATGVRFPMVRLAGPDDPPEGHGFPILYGVDHVTTLRLWEEGRLGTPTPVPGSDPGGDPSPPSGADPAPGWSGPGASPPGEGFVEVVEEALEDRHALVVGGSDEAGLAAASRLIAHRFPYLHLHRKGAYGLRDVEEEVRRFFQGRGVAGQTALAMVKLDEWMDRLEAGERPGIPPSDQAGQGSTEAPGWRPGSPIRGLQVELAVDTVPPGLDELLRRRVQSRFPDVPVEVTLLPSAFGAGEEILVEERTFPWEVAEAWDALRSEVLPGVGADTRGRIELRVSEPLEVRQELAAALRDSIAARGGDPAGVEVVVLNAFKQGFSWIEDAVVPALRERLEGGAAGAGPVPARIEIEYHHLQDAHEIPWQVIGSDTRWLQELFPVEEILAREMGMADTSVVFRGVPSPEHTYRLRAWDAAGGLVLEDTFSPRYRVMPYFALYPEYERVRVPTGWLRAELDGEMVADRRIPTDLDRFWSFWQEEVQPALRDYVMDLHEGRVTPATAPYFDELRIEARLSEPNHRIGVDEEVISSLESLHNDLYFTTLAFFSHLGQHYGVGGLNYPGRVLPFIDPGGQGREGWTRVVLTGRSRAAPELILRVEGGAEATATDGSSGRERSVARRDLPRWRYALQPIPTEPPKLRGAAVQAGTNDESGDSIRRLLFEVVAIDSVGRFDEHRDQAPEGAVDRTFLSVEMLAGMVEAAGDLHAAGLLENALAFQGVGELAFRFRVERADAFRRHAVLPESARPASTERPELLDRGFQWEDARRELEAGGASMVQWTAPIPPPESDSILARLAAFPEAEVYHVGRSFLGKDLWAADFLPPVEGAFRSRRRLTALRPTVFLSGRQHANEVSSTSHILRLGELLVTDPGYRELLRRVNVVLNPILNADGAQLAYDLQRVNPDFTLHAGYLGALGMDVTSGSGIDPLYPESRVRPEIMEAWLPDAYLNLHGYPSHEWVQHFSGYAAWVRGRTVAQRSWWAPRGWFIPGFSWVDDPEHPEIKEAQFAILDSLAASITSLPEVEAMNRRQYARYSRYGRQDVEGFREGFHQGMLVYLALRGREATGDGPENPRILTFAATTEAPDETARGEWLELVATAGLAHTSALIRYMAAGDPRVERTSEAFRDVVSRSVSRARPVLVQDEEGEQEGGDGSRGR